MKRYRRMRRAQRIDENSKKLSSYKKTYSTRHIRTVDGNLENSKKLSLSVKNKKLTQLPTNSWFTSGMHQPASSYVGYSRQTHGGITRTNRRHGSVLLQESPEGFWQAAPRDFEDSIVDPTHCSPHCFSSRASVPELSPRKRNTQ